MFVFVKHLESS